jgi:hypothetical protein
MKKITGHVMYMGPQVVPLGLHYNKTFLPGYDFALLYPWIEQCPALAELFVPVEQIARVRRELNFDYAHNMRGGTGPYATFYREIQRWLAKQTSKTKPAQPGITLQTHHA